MMIPGGPEKGLTLAEASVKTLEYWHKRLSDKGEARDEALIAAMGEELKRRGGAPDSRPAAGAAPTNGARKPPATALAHRQSTLLAGATHDPIAVSERLREAVEQYHLVSPATSCDVLPPGCGVAMSLVVVNPDTSAGEVYSVGGGKFGLSGNAMKRIAAAAGVDWDPMRSGRLDNGRDHHYCHYRAVGTVKNFDGSIRTVSGEVEMDMRDGSPQVVAMEQRARDGKNFESQLRDTRLFLLRHAETKAKLRAISDMGLKRSYTAAELSKPFAVARIMWTGKTDDPVLKQEAFRMQHAAMTGATGQLYGHPPAGGALPQFTGHGPPPVGAVDDDDYGAPPLDTDGEPGDERGQY